MTTRVVDYSLAAVDAPRVAIVVSKTNDFVTARLLEGAVAGLQARGVEPETILEVAGSFELVCGARMLFDSGAEGVLAIGAIIRGETPHFDYIASAVAEGLAGLSAQGRPVGFGVLTVDTTEQASARAGGVMGNKGAEAAEALLALVLAGRRLREGSRS